MFVDNVNLSVALVENGLAKVHFTAERSSYFKELELAQDRAKSKKIGVWKDHVEEIPETPVIEDTERKTNYKKVFFQLKILFFKSNCFESYNIF